MKSAAEIQNPLLRPGVLERTFLTHEEALQALAAYLDGTDATFLQNLREGYAKPLRAAKKNRHNHKTAYYAVPFLQIAILIADTRKLLPINAEALTKRSHSQRSLPGHCADATNRRQELERQEEDASIEAAENEGLPVRPENFQQARIEIE